MRFRLIALIGIMAFLVSFLTFAQPGNAQAALTLNNFFGCETNGLDELISSAGTPICQSTILRTGDWTLELNGSSEKADLAIITGGSTDSDNDFILGFALRSDTCAGLAQFFLVLDDSGNTVLDADINSSCALLFDDAEGVDICTTSSNTSTSSFTYVEIRWQHSASGSLDVFFDGSSVCSETAQDMTDGGAISADNALYRFQDASQARYIDDFYAYSGATGTGDFLGDAEVFRYQANTNSAVGDSQCFDGTKVDLAFGVHQDYGETPLSSDATEPGYDASITGGAAIFTEDTQSGDNFRHGPHGDSDIDGDSNIKGGKWLHRLKRSNGSATTWELCYGRNGGLESPSGLTLTVSFTNFFTIKTTASLIPTTAHHCAFGFKVVNTGGRDPTAEEIWCFLLHVPDAGGAPRRIFPVQ